MRVRISTPDSKLSEVSRRMHFTLASIAEYASEVHVTVTDLKDCAGKKLTRCQVELQLQAGGRVSVTEVQPGMGLAVSRAMQRIVRSVQRRARIPANAGVMLREVRGTRP